MPACPPLVVNPPPITPHRFGLLSAALVIEETDPHFECGVVYQTTACATAVSWVDVCPPDTPVAKPEGTQTALAEGTPFAVVANWDCGLLGMTMAEHEQAARDALICAEGRAVEEAYYSGSAGNDPYLADEPCTTLNTTGTAVSLYAGVGMLEEALGTDYCGVGIIHAPRALGAMASRFHQTFGAGAQLRTALGNLWAFGAGYGNTSPAGVAAPNGVGWVYVTGMVTIRRSEIFLTPPTPVAGVDRATNQMEIRAERIYVITQEPCVCAAVAVCTI